MLAMLRPLRHKNPKVLHIFDSTMACVYRKLIANVALSENRVPRNYPKINMGSSFSLLTWWLPMTIAPAKPLDLGYMRLGRGSRRARTGRPDGPFAGWVDGNGFTTLNMDIHCGAPKR